MKKFKWFWFWQDGESEDWLQDMAGQGWKLKAIPLPGIYSFEPITPTSLAYRLDYHNRQKHGMNAYLDTFFDDGWEFITRLNGWLYFCKTTSDVSGEERKKDPQAKIDKLNRDLSIMGSLIPLMSFWYPLFGSQVASPLHEILLVVYLLSLALLLFIILKGYQRMRALRQQS